ncbi:MAG: hypothetical protein AB1457_03560 [Chloroflexota bacterium]|nr:MAG: hypothetical protein KatS3mg047_1083 [Bellilinea sp.]
MSAGKIIALIIGGILIFFGVLFIWGSTGDQGTLGWIPIGVITVAIGLALVFLATRKSSKPEETNVTVKIDLPGDVNLDVIKCRSCGGTLKPEDIKMVAGAPVVTCPYCHTTYQLTEEPKW